MIDRLYCLNVREFFSNINWQGKSPESQDRSYDCSENLRSLAVAEFFSRINWQGRALKLNSQQTSTAFSVTLPVGELFRLFIWEYSLFIWEYKSEIAVLPQLTPSSPSNRASPEINLKNLTDLF